MCERSHARYASPGAGPSAGRWRPRRASDRRRTARPEGPAAFLCGNAAGPSAVRCCSVRRRRSGAAAERAPSYFTVTVLTADVLDGAGMRDAHADLVLALLGGRLPLERVGAGRREVGGRAVDPLPGGRQPALQGRLDRVRRRPGLGAGHRDALPRLDARGRLDRERRAVAQGASSRSSSAP